MSKGAKPWRVPTSGTPSNPFKTFLHCSRDLILTTFSDRTKLETLNAQNPERAGGWKPLRRKPLRGRDPKRGPSTRHQPGHPKCLATKHSEFVSSWWFWITDLFLSKAYWDNSASLLHLKIFFSGLCVLRDNTGVKSAIETYKDRFWCRCFKTYIKKC